MYCLRQNEEYYGFYVFKNGHTHYEKYNEGNTLEINAVNFNRQKYTGVFVLGALFAIQSIVKYVLFSNILVNNLSDNNILINDFNKNDALLQVESSSYYLYNFIYPTIPVNPNKCCILI